MQATRSLDPGRHAQLLRALEAEARAYPLERKLLVCRRHAEGLELLRSLAAAGVPWIGFQATTPKRLALEVLGGQQAWVGGALVDEFDEQALMDEAIDHVLQSGRTTRFTALAEGVGLRRALARAVQALRLAGIEARTVRRQLDDPAKREALAAILERYDALREKSGRVDAAELFARARAALDADRLPAARLLILPGHNLRGVSGRMLRRLIDLGAVVLPEDDAIGLAAPGARLRGSTPDAQPSTSLAYLHDIESAPAQPPELSLFAATSLEAELREVLRRIITAGASWDEAEIAATDPSAYGVALDALARRLDVPVSYATGLPVARTRPGRVVATYLRWIDEDFREDVIRGLIERSEIQPPAPHERAASGPTLARRLRLLRIGRGRERYLQNVRAAIRALDAPPDEDDPRSAEDIERDRERDRDQLRALDAMLSTILDATPLVADLPQAQRRVSPAALARGLSATLALAPVASELDRVAHDRLMQRLERIEATLTRETTLRGALATLEEKLDDRVPAPEAGGRAPWQSSGGRLHFTDLDGAGLSARRLTFIVGMDAGRFPAFPAQDALLSDGDRRRLAFGQPIASLPTSSDRIDEARYAFAAALARLRGHVTISYAAWSAAEGRSVAPAAELLQAFRLARRDPTADYEQMRTALAPSASAVPRTGAAQLDAADVWLAALDDGGVLRRGDDAVRAAYPALARGIAGAAARAGAAVTAWHGVLQPRPSFDPRSRETPMSASRLQALGECPHRYLILHVLGIRAPDDREAEPGRWLTPLVRGAVLHDVFERALTQARSANPERDATAVHAIAATVLDTHLDELNREQPAPGPAVFEAERRALHADVRAFARMVVDEDRTWIALEENFGGADSPVQLPLRSGALRVQGKIDRVDRTADGELVVVDYKTGSMHRFRRETGIYSGGRRLQHAFYTAGAEALHDAPVRAVEYHFPGEKGRNERAVYRREHLDGSHRLIEHLVDIAAKGWFVPTDDAREDCTFCDVRHVCRVTGEGDRIASPMAAWSKEQLESDAEALRALRLLRAW